jgi:hypothetical protein
MAITTTYTGNPRAIRPIDLASMFTYHPPKSDQTERYEALRRKALELAIAIVDYCPPSADTTTAIRKLREVVMVSNAAIACGE